MVPMKLPTQHATMPWGPASLAFFGIAFARVWLSFVFVEPAVASGALGLPHDVFDWAFSGVSLLIAVFARRLVPLSAKGWAYGAVLAGMLASSACSMAGAVVGVPTAAVLAGALGGRCVLRGLFGVERRGVRRREPAAHRALPLGQPPFGIAHGLPARLRPTRPAWGRCSCSLPCVAVALLRSSYRTLPVSDRQHAAYPQFSYPWKLLVLLGVFSFAYGLRQGALVAGAGQHSSFSTAIAMGAVFVLTYFFAGRIDVARLCRLPLPIMAFGLLLVPSSGLLGQVASSYLISIAYTLVTFTIGILFYDMSKRTGVAIAPLIAAMNTMQICVVLGNYATHALDGLLPDAAAAHTAATVLVCVALVALFFLLFSERELSARWGIRVLQGASLGEEARESDRITSRCEELVQMYGLTAREAEVLRELAQQKDNQVIAGNLLIAPGTLKAHTRHIYEKMGIHTRAELNALLGIEPKTP